MKLTTFNKCKITLILIITLGVLSPSIVGYLINLKAKFNSNYAISIYGVYSLFYIFAQIICSYLNRKKINKDNENRTDNWD
jgi:hypothetical protein